MKSPHHIAPALRSHLSTRPHVSDQFRQVLLFAGPLGCAAQTNSLGCSRPASLALPRPSTANLQWLKDVHIHRRVHINRCPISAQSSRVLSEWCRMGWTPTTVLDVAKLVDVCFRLNGGKQCPLEVCVCVCVCVHVHICVSEHALVHRRVKLSEPLPTQVQCHQKESPDVDLLHHRGSSDAENNNKCRYDTNLVSVPYLEGL